MNSPEYSDAASSVIGSFPLSWAQEKAKHLFDPHMAPLTQYVLKMRQELPDRSVPFFDTDDGGIHGRVLLLKEAPGPTAIYSQFVAPENGGQTAKNMRELRIEAGLEQRFVVNWNIVPWYVGNETKTKIAPASKHDIDESAHYIQMLLDMLPDLRAVVLMGGKAQKGWRIRKFRTVAGLEVIETSHPSPLAVNTRQGARESIVAGFKRAQQLAAVP